MRRKIDEITRSQVVRGTDAGSAARSRQVPSYKYLGVDRNYVIYMSVASATLPGKSYLVKCRMKELPEIIGDNDITMRDKVRLALDGDIKVSCSCPAFLYWGYDYIVSQLDTKEGDPEKRFPIIRNPRLQGTLCKHAYKALKALPLLQMRVVSDLLDERYYVPQRN